MEIRWQVDCHMEPHEERVRLKSSIRRWINNYSSAARRVRLKRQHDMRMSYRGNLSAGCLKL